MTEPHTEPQLDEFLEILKPGAHLDPGVVADDFVIALGVDIVNYPKFPRVTTASPTPRPRSTSASRSMWTPEPSWATTAAPTVPTSASPISPARPWPPGSYPGAKYLVLCVEGWAAEVAKRYGVETMAEIEWAAWNDQVVPELARMKSEFLPAGTVYEDPNRPVAEADRARTRVCTPACSPQTPTPPTSPRRSSSPGSWAPTSTCCSASRPGRRRSRSVTGSTSCSTSSTRCGGTSYFPA